MADNAKWYVAHTYSGYENAVKTAIEKFVANRHLEDMILDIQIPLETVTEVTDSGETKEVERKVFPGYVLVKMIMTDDTWHLIRNIRGVTGFVGTANNEPIPLTEEEVLALGMERREIVVRYNVGDQVKITDGPLSSFLGTVEEIDGRVFQRAFGQAELENGISHCTPLWDQIRVRNSGKPYRRGVHARSSFCTLHGRLPRRSVR